MNATIGTSLVRLNYAVAAWCVLAAGDDFQRSLKAGFRPDEPRVPAGGPGGGQWTDGGLGGFNSARIVRVGGEERDAEDLRNIAGRLIDATPAEAARLEISHAQMEAAVRRVQQLDPKWRPRPSLYETPAGEIAANEAATREAQERLFELQRVGIGPGPFAVESQPARGPGRRWTAEEIRENNRIGETYGCHTCGTREPGTTSGNYFLDHQKPSALLQEGEGQRIFPQCATCSASQGSYVRQLRSRFQQ
jgi:hypothetical protein